MNWYQVKARLDREQSNGGIKSVSEIYLVKTLTFGMAERAVLEEVAKRTYGEVDVVSIARKNFSEVIIDTGTASKIDGEARQMLGQTNASTEADKWFKCKVNFLSIDEKSGKEKKTAHHFLVKANSALTAHQLVDEFMQSSLSTYEVEQIDDTKILEVFEVHMKSDSNQSE